MSYLATSLTHDSLHRNLTKRQRAILQEYADDVEGKVTPSPSTVTETPSTSSEKETDENGTTVFSSWTRASYSVAGGWIARIWQRFHGLLS